MMILNGLTIFLIYIVMPLYVLSKFCVSFPLKIYGFCLKLNTYVCPKVEFNTCVWNPYLKKDIVLLESVQRNFNRHAFIRYNIPLL